MLTLCGTSVCCIRSSFITLLIRYAPRASRDWGAAMQPMPYAQPHSPTGQVWELPMTGRETPFLRRVAQQALSLRCAANSLLHLHLPLSRTPAPGQLLCLLLVTLTRQPLCVLLGTTWHISQRIGTASIECSPSCCHANVLPLKGQSARRCRQRHIIPQAAEH